MYFVLRIVVFVGSSCKRKLLKCIYEKRECIFSYLYFGFVGKGKEHIQKERNQPMWVGCPGGTMAAKN